MNEPELPDELQRDQDRYYREIHGSVDEMLIVEEWHSTSAARLNIEGEHLWCHVLNLRGTVGACGPPVQITVAIPLDSAKAIAANMTRCADMSEEEMEREGRVI